MPNRFRWHIEWMCYWFSFRNVKWFDKYVWASVYVSTVKLWSTRSVCFSFNFCMAKLPVFSKFLENKYKAFLLKKEWKQKCREEAQIFFFGWSVFFLAPKSKWKNNRHLSNVKNEKLIEKMNIKQKKNCNIFLQQ